MQFQDQVKVPIHLIPRGSKDFLQLIHHSAARQYMVEMLSYPHVIVLGAIAGLASHQIYNRYEPSVVRFLFNTCVLVAASVAVAYRVNADVVSALGCGIVFGGCYLLSLVLSIVVYRLYLHPLKKYPGPTLAKLTKWAGFYYSSTGHLHDIVPELHRQYGDVMRIGPNELSFSSPDAVRDIHGANSALLPKGPAYGTKLWADGSGMTNSPLPVHKLRRKAWEKGLNSKALVDYEPRILRLTDRFVEKMKMLEGQVIDMGAWIDYIAFDTMGDLAFDEPFGFLEAGKIDDLADFTRNGLRMTHLMSNVPWLASLWKNGWINLDPELQQKVASFKRVSREQFDKRQKRGTKPKDLFTYILNTKQETGLELSQADLASDAPIIIIAGSDTTAVCLTFVLYYVARDPGVRQRLIAEIDQHFETQQNPLSGSKLDPTYMPYMNGVINESLRLVPPAPNGNQRQTPKGGHHINGEYIPPFTQVASNTSAMQRDSRYFTNPDDFIPERWNDEKRDPSWNHNPKAFIPFSMGQYGCVGKGLALLEMRLFLTEVFRYLDFEMSPAFDHRAFWVELKSFMGMVKSPLPLTVRVRNQHL